MTFRLKTLVYLILTQFSVASYAFSLPSLLGSSTIRKFLSSSYSAHFDNFENVTPEELETHLDKVKSKGTAVVPDLKEALSWWFETHETINEEWQEYYLTKSGKKIRPTKELRRLFLTGISGPMPFDYSVWRFEVCNPQLSSNCSSPNLNITVKMIADPSVEHHGRWFEKYHLNKIKKNLNLVKNNLSGTPLIFGQKRITTPSGVKKLAVLCEDTGDDFRDTHQLPDFTDPAYLKSFAVQALKIIEQYIQLGMYTEAIDLKHFSYRDINGKKQLILSDLELGVHFQDFLDSGNGPIQFGYSKYFSFDSLLSDKLLVIKYKRPGHVEDRWSIPVWPRNQQHTLSYTLGMVLADLLTRSAGYGPFECSVKHWKRLNFHSPTPKNVMMAFNREIKEIDYIKKRLDKISYSNSDPTLSKQIGIIKNMISVPQEDRITISQALQEFQHTTNP